MTGKAMHTLVAGLMLPAFMAHSGGWAVITVDELPDYAVSGRPLVLSYMVRQHGVTPLEQLRTTVTASSGRLTASAVIRPAAEDGRYSATLTLPAPGDWSLTIRSGFGNSDITLLPLPVVASAAGHLTTAVSDVDRGRRLFVAKGCVTCHVQMAVGPRLDGKRWDAAYVSEFLANPGARPPRYGQTSMPNLGLRQPEIASLVAYLNAGGPAQAASR